MVSSQFGAILKEFESFFNCALEPDLNNSCLLNLAIGISVQIELDRYGFLLIGCRLGALPMSRYRDNLIQLALKANDISLPTNGVFGFSQKSNNLILFLKFDPNHYTTNQMLSFLPGFIAKAKLWKEAIDKGETPKIQESEAKTPSGLFGLIS